MRRLVHGLVGAVCGLVAALVILLALVVVRARLMGVFVHSIDELPVWMALPAVVLLLLGGWLGGSRHHRLGPSALGGFVGLGVGAGIGAVVGGLASSDPSWPWAGGIMGGATGLVAGFVGRAVRDVRDLRGGRRGGGSAALVVGAALAMLAGGCEEAPVSLPEPGRYAEPDAAEVRSVVYLVGDPGEARLHTHPVLTAVRRDVERWSERLGPAGDVLLLLLGDIVYPEGLREPSAPEFPEDSARVADQIAMVAGPAARRAGARGMFLAGNHDWGQRKDWEGAERLRTLERFLRRHSTGGVAVGLRPDAGEGGPVVVDVGDELRLVLLDTAWWLYAGEPANRARVLGGVRHALATAADRRVVMAAHHPLRSGGPHGHLETMGSTLGIRHLLARSGALLQDLHSEPYRELLLSLEEIFRDEGPPEVFAGGHEHSLQVIRRKGPVEPAVNLVSGSASKLTEVDPVAGTVFAASAPGYARLFVLEDGTLWLSVEAAPPRYLACPEEPQGDGRGSCLEQGVEAFRTVWAGEV